MYHYSPKSSSSKLNAAFGGSPKKDGTQPQLNNNNRRFDEVFVGANNQNNSSNLAAAAQNSLIQSKLIPKQGLIGNQSNQNLVKLLMDKGNNSNNLRMTELGLTTPSANNLALNTDEFIGKISRSNVATSSQGRQSSPAAGAIAGTNLGPNTSNIRSDRFMTAQNNLIQQQSPIVQNMKSSLEDKNEKGKKGSKPRENIQEKKLTNQTSQNSFGNAAPEDSFQRLYSKELDIDEDEVPLILHELNDSAIHFISKDQFDRALSLLQKAQTLLDRLMFQRNASDRFLIQCTMHNMALCFQKMGALEECSLCLDACLTQMNSPYVERLFKGDAPRKLKRLKYECRIHMQVCALLSQLNRHQEALCHAKRAVQISQYMINDLMELCETLNQKIKLAKKREQVAQDVMSRVGIKDATEVSQYLKQILGDTPEFTDEFVKDLTENNSRMNKSDLIYFDEQVSMLERTALKFYPIIQEVARRMTRHKENPLKDKSRLNIEEEINKDHNRSKFDHDLKSFREFEEKQKTSEGNPYQSNWIMQKQKELRARAERDKSLSNQINMRVLLGYLNQAEWMYLLNIGNIMQITPLTIHDLHSNCHIDVELSRDSIIEKISFLAVSYFCVSTELRFLVNIKENPNVDPVQVKAESEYWHGKALEISCTFLPSESPLVSHIYQSYKKHHAPVQQVIPEDSAQDGDNKKKQIDSKLDLKVIRPLAGIDQAKYQPLVRANTHMNIALSPLNLSPNNYVQKQQEKQIGILNASNIKSAGKSKIQQQKDQNSTEGASNGKLINNSSLSNKRQSQLSESNNISQGKTIKKKVAQQFFEAQAPQNISQKILKSGFDSILQDQVQPNALNKINGETLIEETMATFGQADLSEIKQIKLQETEQAKSFNTRGKLSDIQDKQIFEITQDKVLTNVGNDTTQLMMEQLGDLTLLRDDEASGQQKVQGDFIMQLNSSPDNKLSAGYMSASDTGGIEKSAGHHRDEEVIEVKDRRTELVNKSTASIVTGGIGNQKREGQIALQITSDNVSIPNNEQAEHPRLTSSRQETENIKQGIAAARSLSPKSRQNLQQLQNKIKLVNKNEKSEDLQELMKTSKQQYRTINQDKIVDQNIEENKQQTPNGERKGKPHFKADFIQNGPARGKTPTLNTTIKNGQQTNINFLKDQLDNEFISRDSRDTIIGTSGLISKQNQKVVNKPNIIDGQFQKVRPKTQEKQRTEINNYSVNSSQNNSKAHEVFDYQNQRNEILQQMISQSQGQIKQNFDQDQIFKKENKLQVDRGQARGYFQNNEKEKDQFENQDLKDDFQKRKKSDEQKKQLQNLQLNYQNKEMAQYSKTPTSQQITEEMNQRIFSKDQNGIVNYQTTKNGQIFQKVVYSSQQQLQRASNLSKEREKMRASIQENETTVRRQLQKDLNLQHSHKTTDQLNQDFLLPNSDALSASGTESRYRQKQGLLSNEDKNATQSTSNANLMDVQLGPRMNTIDCIEQDNQKLSQKQNKKGHPELILGSMMGDFYKIQQSVSTKNKPNKQPNTTVPSARQESLNDDERNKNQAGLTVQQQQILRDTNFTIQMTNSSFLSSPAGKSPMRASQQQFGQLNKIGQEVSRNFKNGALSMINTTSAHQFQAVNKSQVMNSSSGQVSRSQGSTRNNSAKRGSKQGNDSNQTVVMVPSKGLIFDQHSKSVGKGLAKPHYKDEYNQQIQQQNQQKNENQRLNYQTEQQQIYNYRSTLTQQLNTSNSSGPSMGGQSRGTLKVKQQIQPSNKSNDNSGQQILQKTNIHSKSGVKLGISVENSSNIISRNANSANSTKSALHMQLADGLIFSSDPQTKQINTNKQVSRTSVQTPTSASHQEDRQQQPFKLVFQQNTINGMQVPRSGSQESEKNSQNNNSQHLGYDQISTNSGGIGMIKVKGGKQINQNGVQSVMQMVMSHRQSAEQIFKPIGAGQIYSNKKIKAAQSQQPNSLASSSSKNHNINSAKNLPNANIVPMMISVDGQSIPVNHSLSQALLNKDAPKLALQIQQQPPQLGDNSQRSSRPSSSKNKTKVIQRAHQGSTNQSSFQNSDFQNLKQTNESQQRSRNFDNNIYQGQNKTVGAQIQYRSNDEIDQEKRPASGNRSQGRNTPQAQLSYKGLQVNTKLDANRRQVGGGVQAEDLANTIISNQNSGQVSVKSSKPPNSVREPGKQIKNYVSKNSFVNR